jgi:hypothetical protein
MNRTFHAHFQMAFAVPSGPIKLQLLRMFINGLTASSHLPGAGSSHFKAIMHAKVTTLFTHAAVNVVRIRE